MAVVTLPLHARSLLAAAAMCAAATGALAQQATEAAVKAAFLFRFAGYIEWPVDAQAPPDAPIVFGVAGGEEVARELEQVVAGRPINNRPAVVRRIKEPTQLRGIHLLFVGRGEANAAALVRQAQQQGVVAVTEGERGLETGSAINFVTSENRVGFEVSLDAAEKSGVRISSRMLAVARRVVPRT